jgi:hypothetical protein
VQGPTFSCTQDWGYFCQRAIDSVAINKDHPKEKKQHLFIWSQPSSLPVAGTPRKPGEWGSFTEENGLHLAVTRNVIYLGQTRHENIIKVIAKFIRKAVPFQ